MAIGRHTRGRRGWWAMALLCAVTSLGVAAGPPRPELSTVVFMQHVRFLASDDLRGRANATPELEAAAAYLAAEFERYGLTPAGDDGSYLQRFPVAMHRTLGLGNTLRIDGTSQRSGHDFVPLPLSSAGAFDGQVVFAGYGITAPQLGWDDYAGVDVQGKAVVVFDYHPPSTALLIRGLGFMSPFEMKVRNAKRHGARALLVVRDPAFSQDGMAGVDTDHVVPDDLGLPAVYVSPRVADRLFARAGTTAVAAKRGIDTSLRPASFALPATIRLEADVRRATTTASNVVGILRAGHPAATGEWLVIGAHYDHLGGGGKRGAHAKPGGRTHYGADDNASGTAGLLELARVLAPHRSSLKRSIVFAAFAAEEIGLLGSGFFVDRPPAPIGAAHAMLNLDMIGRLSDAPLSVMGSKVPEPLAEWIRTENRDVGLSVSFATSVNPSSDWAMFQAAGIPAVTFFTGMHEDYHGPSDTPDKINAGGAIKVLTLVAAAARRLAAGDALLERTPPGPIPLDAEPGPAFLGNEPVFDAHLDALRFDHVAHDSPAGRAGVRPGDVVVQFGEFPIKTVRDFRWTLESFRPGDMPALDVHRGGRLMRFAVALERPFRPSSAR